MKFNIEGEVIKTEDARQVTETFKVRDIVVEVPNGNYPEYVTATFKGDNTEALNGVNVGDEVNIYAALGGRKGKDDKYWNSVTGIKIEVKSKSKTPAPDDNAESNDDLPF